MSGRTVMRGAVSSDFRERVRAWNQRNPFFNLELARNLYRYSKQLRRHHVHVMRTSPRWGLLP